MQTNRFVIANRIADCVHLLSATSRLPEQSLSDGFIPRCKRDGGDFEDVQCDKVNCWCVDKKGVEIIGTKVMKDRTPNCFRELIQVFVFS